MDNYYKCDLGHEQIAGAVSLCDRCIVAREHQRVKLLEFVKEIGQIETKIREYLKFNGFNLETTNMLDEANKLLKEIGEL